MSRNDTPTRILRDQHELILKVAAVLERALSGGEASQAGAPDAWDPEAWDYDALADCIAFIRLYADALHHGKEEDLLFPELVARGLPRQAGPIAVMLAEHARGRAFAREMAEALPRARAGDEDAARSLRSAGLGYVDLIRGHILKENNVLFDMADRMVDGPACRSLCQAYEGVCQRRFEGCTVAELEAIAARLMERYPDA